MNELGANFTVTTNTGVTLAHSACENGQLEALRLLHDLGANLMALTINGSTLGYHASLNGSVEVLRELHSWAWT